jgi:hypothetical protein
VIQSTPAGCSSSLIRASVIMPRSPTRTTRRKPKRWRSLSIWVLSVLGSAVLPANTSTAIGQPSRAQHAKDDLQFVGFAVAVVAEPRQRAASAFQIG